MARKAFRSCIEQPPANIDFRLPDIDNTYIPEDCLDSSDLDQYLPSENAHVYQGSYQSYLKSSTMEEDESNNNHKNKRLCAGEGLPNPGPHQHDGYESYQNYLKSSLEAEEDVVGHHKGNKRLCPSEGINQGHEGYDAAASLMRYHELQPSSSLVKTERFPSVPATTSVYSYQSGVPLPASASYYTNSGHQYLPSYQYLPQRTTTVFGNTTIGSYGVDGNATESWGHYSM